MLFVTGIIFLLMYIFQNFTATTNYMLNNFMLLMQKLIILLPIVIIYNLFDKNKWVIGLKGNNRLRIFIKGSFIGLLFISTSIVIILLLSSKSVFFHTINFALISSLIYSIGYCLLTAFSEEVLFRGYIQGLAKYHYNYKVGIIFSTIFFVSMHGLNSGINIFAYLQLFLGGIFLGLLREKTNGLWFGIGFHFLWNFVQAGIFSFSICGQKIISILSVNFVKNNFLTGGNYGPEASIITSIVLIFGLSILVIKYSKINPDKLED